MKKIVLAAFAALALLTSCSLDVDYVYMNANYLIANENGGEYTTTLYANGSWTATISATETFDITMTPTSGTGDTQVTFIIGQMNQDLEEGEEPNDYEAAYITLACGKSKTTFPVYQVTNEYMEKLQEGSESL